MIGNKKYLIILVAVIISCNKSEDSSTIQQSDTARYFDKIDKVFLTQDNGFIISGVYDKKAAIALYNKELDFAFTKNNFEYGCIVYPASGYSHITIANEIINMFQSIPTEFIFIISSEEGFNSISRVNNLGVEVATGQEHFPENTTIWGDDIVCFKEGLLISYGQNFHRDLVKGIRELVDEVELLFVVNENIYLYGRLENQPLSIIMLDEAFKEIWRREYPQYRVKDIIGLNDRTLLFVGSANASDNQFNGVIAKLNETGDTLWTKQIDFNGNQSLERIVFHSNNKFVFEGKINNTEDLFYLLTDNQGVTLGLYELQHGEKIVVTKDGFIVKIRLGENGRPSLTRFEFEDIFK